MGLKEEWEDEDAVYDVIGEGEYASIVAKRREEGGQMHQQLTLHCMRGHACKVSSSKRRQHFWYACNKTTALTSHHAHAVFLQVILSKTMTVWGMWMSAKRTTGVLKTALQVAAMRITKQSLTLNARRPASRKRVRVYFKMSAIKLFTMALEALGLRESSALSTSLNMQGKARRKHLRPQRQPSRASTGYSQLQQVRTGHMAAVWQHMDAMLHALM